MNDTLQRVQTGSEDSLLTSTQSVGNCNILQINGSAQGNGKFEQNDTGELCSRSSADLLNFKVF